MTFEQGTLPAATHWRLFTFGSGPSGSTWDVEHVQFDFLSPDVTATPICSGDAGAGFACGHAFDDTDRIWGGRPNAAGELFIGVSLDQAAAPAVVTFAHAANKHRTNLVLLQSSRDRVDWTTHLYASLGETDRRHTVLYAPADPPSYPAWRLAGRANHDFWAWDVLDLQVLRAGLPQACELTGSGDAGESYGVENLQGEGPGRWGGRPDESGRFHLTMRNDDGLVIDRIVLEQSAKHSMRSLDLQYETPDGWKPWRRFKRLRPGRNELFVGPQPPPLTEDRVRPLDRTALDQALQQARTDRALRPDVDRRILILIASYRDHEIANTVRSALEMAACPNDVRFAICHQFDSDTKHLLDEWKADHRFSIDEVPFAQSQGCCWARNRTFRLFDDEAYILQIDAHTRFADQWDLRYIHMLETADSSKPIITSYPSSFTIGDDGEVELDTTAGPQRLVIAKERDDLTVLQTTEKLVDQSAPQPSPTLAAGQLFTIGQFCHDVDYDPQLYFAGEELSLAARAFTSGYDLFCPNDVLIWHLYEHDEPKHWEDHDTYDESHVVAVKRLRTLFQGDQGALGRYGLGTTRSLAEFEALAGVDLQNAPLSQLERRFAKDESAAVANADAVEGEASVITIDRSGIEARDDYAAFLVVLFDAEGCEVARHTETAPQVLALKQGAIELPAPIPAGATHFAVVPQTEAGVIGVVALRALAQN